jgi:hypothetical protein
MNNPESPRLPFKIKQLLMYTNLLDKKEEADAVGNTIDMAAEQAVSLADFVEIIKENTNYEAYPEIITPRLDEETGEYGFSGANYTDVIAADDNDQSRIIFFPKGTDFNKVRNPGLDSRAEFEIVIGRAD